MVVQLQPQRAQAVERLGARAGDLERLTPRRLRGGGCAARTRSRAARCPRWRPRSGPRRRAAGRGPCPRSRRAGRPGMAAAVARPPDGRIMRSLVPWMTTVGAVIVRSCRGAVAGREDRRELARRSRRGCGRARSRAAAAARSSSSSNGKPGEPISRNVETTDSIASSGAGGRLADEDRVDAQARRAAPEVPGVGHDRGERAHALGMLDGERLGDHPAHRGAGDVRALDPEVVEQPGRVVGHVGERVGGGGLVAQQRAA